MVFECQHGFKQAVWGLAAAVLVPLALGAAAAARADGILARPIAISGQYSIHFNGFDIGTVRIDQRVAGRAYSANSRVEISALLGAFHWQGVTRSAGTLTAEGLEPSGYDFEYQGSTKSGSVSMGFTKGIVTSLTALPATVEPDDFVRLGPSHIRSVIDPLSAIVAMSRPAAQPCGRKLPIFDGKQRFDISLLQVRREAVPAGRNAETVTGVVCRVKYTPVAGYRANSETAALAETTGIEVTFRPVVEAGMWSPYRVSIPTMAGTVALEATRYDISAPGLAEIALVD